MSKDRELPVRCEEERRMKIERRKEEFEKQERRIQKLEVKRENIFVFILFINLIQKLKLIN